jgi:hypothetical protein
MKIARFILVLGGALLLAGCLFERPVFTAGFTALPEAMAGVWVSVGDATDPRKSEYAVLAPIEGDRWLLAHPAGPGAETVYYEVRGRTPAEGRQLLQLRTMSSFSRGIPGTEEKNYTVIELKHLSPTEVQVRLLDDNGVLKGKSAEDAARLLESPAANSEGVFTAEPMKFRQLPNS